VDALLEKVWARVMTLADFPEAGRAGRVAGTYEWVIEGTPYVVAYRIREGSIEILAVIHASRRWPNSF
jgi:toxin ParE1/3/4